EMRAFATDHESNRRARGERGENVLQNSANSARSAVAFAQALRRCRQPVPARVAVEHGAPVRVTTDRRGFAGGTVVTCAGPWRTSGEWWASQAGRAGEAGAAGTETRPPIPPVQPFPPIPPRAWNRDEGDVAPSHGAGDRIFQDSGT